MRMQDPLIEKKTEKSIRMQDPLIAKRQKVARAEGIVEKEIGARSFHHH